MATNKKEYVTYSELRESVKYNMNRAIKNKESIDVEAVFDSITKMMDRLNELQDLEFLSTMFSDVTKVNLKIIKDTKATEILFKKDNK